MRLQRPLVWPGELGLRGAVRLGERVVTPARGLAVVALAASVILAASQFSDYRAVEIGTPSYSGVKKVAPAPDVDRRTPRSAHGLTVLAIATAGFAVTMFAVAGRWRLARLLVLLGAAVVAISLLVDAREGLREGLATTTYEGAKAVLLGGFWAQLASGVTLIVSGPLLAVHLRDERRGARRARPTRRAEGPSVGTATPSVHAGGSGAEGAAT